MLSDGTVRGDAAKVLYYIRLICNALSFIQFQELTGRPVKAACNGLGGRKHSAVAKGFSFECSQKDFSGEQLLCMFYFYLLGCREGGGPHTAPSRKKKGDDMELKLLILAGVKH